MCKYFHIITKLSNDLERYIISFLDYTSINLIEYITKNNHRIKYKKSLLYFNEELLTKYLFSKFIDINTLNIPKNKIYKCGFKMNKFGEILKGSGKYKGNGVDFALYNGKFFICVLPNVIMDFWLYTKKQKIKIWILSKTLHIYP